MFANITEVYFYDNKLLEKILPKTYTMMKKFYDEI
jgi:Mlc titration factor MtfA (ptsG expression regulator)